MLEVVLEQQPDWDEAGEYRAHNVNVYYEGADKSYLYQVDVNHTLGTIISKKK